MYKGSDEYIEYICDPCSTVGDHVEAHGFCTNCEEYLCGTCFRSHIRSKLSRDHVLLDKDNMPKKSVAFCDPCKTAGDEVEAAGYCTDCDEHLCESCYRSHAGSKATKHHVLIDKDNIPRKGETVVSSLAVLSINNLKEGAGTPNYSEEYTYIRDIDVASPDDDKKCLITDMVVMGNSKLILADFSNQCLKLVDVENHVIKSSLKLEAKPFGLTTLSHDQVAVGMDTKYKINVVSTSGDLTVKRTLKTTEDPVDLKYINGKFYVTFCNPLKLQILQPTGAVYKTIEPDPEVLELCTEPRYIAVNRDESMIYISDWKNNEVLCIDMNGKLVARFNDELKCPHDIAISRTGSVYLCNSDQHVVYKMAPNLKEATIILGPGDGLSFPRTMCFDVDKQICFVSSRSDEETHCNFIKVYGWK